MQIPTTAFLYINLYIIFRVFQVALNFFSTAYLITDKLYLRKIQLWKLKQSDNLRDDN